MRRLGLLGAGIATLLIAGVASAAPMNYSGTSYSRLGVNPVGIGSGMGVATINGSAGVMGGHIQTLRQALSRGNVGGTFTTIITDPVSIGNGIAALIYSNYWGNTGTFAPISAGAASGTPALTQNVLKVSGLVKVCLVTTQCDTFIPLILTKHTAGSATMGVGVGGVVYAGAGVIRISLINGPWTIKTTTMIDHITTKGGNTTFVNVTRKGFAHAPGSGTTGTATISGVVQLVAPIQVRTNLPFGSSVMQSNPVVTRIHFMPEPGMLLLLGSGVVGAALLGRRRMRK